MTKKASSHNPTVAPYKKGGATDKAQAVLADALASEIVRQGFRELTGIELGHRLGADGKIWLEIPREVEA